MALAILELVESAPGAVRVRGQIGDNRYYRYAVGSRVRPLGRTIQAVEDPVFVSPLMGPLPEPALGRIEFSVPATCFDSGYALLQLTSFRTADHRGPALSRVIQVRPPSAPYDDLLPERAMSASTRPRALRVPRVSSVPFQVAESGPLSEAQFLASIGSMISSALPALSNLVGSVGPALGNLLGGAGGAGGFVTKLLGGLAGSDVGKLLGGLDLGKLLGGVQSADLKGLADGATDAASTVTKILELVNKVSGAGVAAPGVAPGFAPVASPPAPPAPAASPIQRLAAQSPAPAGPGLHLTGDPQSLALLLQLVAQLALARDALASPAPSPGGSAAVHSNGSTPVSQAQAAPALLALIPALLPLLQKVLDPATVKAVLEQPGKLIGAIGDAVTKVGSVAVQGDKDEMEWLAKMNPGTGTEDLVALMSSVGSRVPRSLAVGAQPRYRRVASVQLHFADARTSFLAGGTRVAYHRDHDLVLGLHVDTPRPVPAPTLEVEIKDARTRAVLRRHRLAPGESIAGDLPAPVRVPARALQGLEPSRPYLLSVTLTWRNGSGERIGTSRVREIYLVGDYSFDRLEESGVPVLLNDFERYRDFAHKVWQDSFTEQSRKFTIDCKYYYVLDAARTANGRMRTVAELESRPSRETTGRLKSGLLVSPTALNSLLERLGSHPVLEDDVLAGLRGPEFVAHYGYAARSRVQFRRGIIGESAALWVYPEVAMRRAVLQRATSVMPDGQVGSFSERSIWLPVPKAVHFVGVMSQRP